jgi:hypothetical protein
MEEIVEQISDENAGKKPTMTPEERMELCAKLDSELDDYISGLERKSYTEGWPEDRWEEVCSCANYYFDAHLNMLNFFRKWKSILSL